MSTHRPRDYSPPRYYVDQPRATTGALYVTPIDSLARGGSPAHTRTSVSGSSSGRAPVEYSAQPMRKSTFADGKTKTEYAIRPRHGSFNPVEDKRPLSVSTRHDSPPRRVPAVIASPREITHTAVRDDSPRFLQPASSYSVHSGGHHQRHNSTSTAEIIPRESRERREKSHQSRAPYVQKVYGNRPVQRVAEEDDWSYTTGQEQFDKGLFRRPPGQKESTSRRERPVPSYYDSDRPNIKRDPAPPPASSQQLVKLDRKEADRSARRSGHESDPDRIAEPPRRRPSTRQTVLHQQPPKDDGYSSARDDYESRHQSKRRHEKHSDRERQRDIVRNNGGDAGLSRVSRSDPRRHNDIEKEREGERERKAYDPDADRYYERGPRRDERDYRRDYKPRSRENSPERSGLKELATTALGGLAAAGVVKGISRDNKDKDPDPNADEDRDRRHRRRRHRSRKDDQSVESDPENDRRREDHARQRRQEQSSSGTSDEQSPRRRRSHHRRRETEDSTNGKLAPVEDNHVRSSSHVRSRDRDERSPDRSSRAAYKEDDEPDQLETRTMSPGEYEDDRPRRVQLVEPPKEKDEVRVKSILKPARQVPFPEDPNPIREGVAPLKDATKDGIPPNARWTKINRVLVNPEALEKAHERFEERDDYVIVLRVLTREEIAKLGEMTKVIRETREREWQQKLERRRRRGKSGDDSSTTNTDDETDRNGDDSKPRSQLAIEQGPAAPPANLYNLQNTPNQQPVHQAVSAGPAVPEINVQSSYSENV